MRPNEAFTPKQLALLNLAVIFPHELLFCPFTSAPSIGFPVRLSVIVRGTPGASRSREFQRRYLCERADECEDNITASLHLLLAPTSDDDSLNVHGQLPWGEGARRVATDGRDGEIIRVR
jgi:hypothetical protein